jgi:hypothetical protein
MLPRLKRAILTGEPPSPAAPGAATPRPLAPPADEADEEGLPPPSGDRAVSSSEERAPARTKSPHSWLLLRTWEEQKSVEPLKSVRSR